MYAASGNEVRDFAGGMTANPAGKPLSLVGAFTVPERRILSEYPDLEAEDIRERLRYAAASVTERELPVPYSA
jgi:hypothetical protein